MSYYLSIFLFISLVFFLSFFIATQRPSVERLSAYARERMQLVKDVWVNMQISIYCLLCSPKCKIVYILVSCSLSLINLAYTGTIVHASDEGVIDLVEIDTSVQGFANTGVSELGFSDENAIVGDQSYENIMESHEKVIEYFDFDQKKLLTDFNQSYDEWVAELSIHRGYGPFQDPVVDPEHVKLYSATLVDPCDMHRTLSEAFDSSNEKAIGYWYDSQVLDKKVLEALDKHLDKNIEQMNKALTLNDLHFDSDTRKALKFTVGRSFDLIECDKNALIQELANQQKIRQEIKVRLIQIDDLKLDVIKSIWLPEYKSPPNFLMDKDFWVDKHMRDIRFKLIKSEYMCLLRGRLKLDGVRNGVSHGANITKALKDCMKQCTSKGCSTSLKGYIPERHLYYRTILEALRQSERRLK